MVKTNWRWGTSWQTAVAIQSAGGADAALVAGWTEVAALAGEGEEAFVAAVGALEAGEAGGEVAAAEEGFDGGDGGGVERAEGLGRCLLLVAGEELSQPWWTICQSGEARGRRGW